MTDGMLAVLVIAVGAILLVPVGCYAVLAREEPPRGRAWILPVLVLSLPAVVATLVHLVFGYPGRLETMLPGLLQDTLFWVWIVAGMLGFVFTPAALIVALAGSWRSTVPARARLVLWGCVVPSLLALAYLTQYFRP
jgi:hypothetical protein